MTWLSYPLGPRTSLNTVEKRKTLAPSRNQTTAIQPISHHCAKYPCSKWNVCYLMGWFYKLLNCFETLDVYCWRFELSETDSGLPESWKYVNKRMLIQQCKDTVFRSYFSYWNQFESSDETAVSEKLCLLKITLFCSWVTMFLLKWFSIEKMIISL